MHLTIQTCILQFRDIYKKQNCMTKGHNFEIKVAVTSFVFNSVAEIKHCQIQTWNFKKESLRLKSFIVYSLVEMIFQKETT